LLHIPRTWTNIPAITFNIADRGGSALVTSGAGALIAAGYAGIKPQQGSVAPAGIAILAYRPGSYLASETGVPVSKAIRSGRMYVEVAGPVNTGLAFANPNGQSATVSFIYTDASGANLGSGVVVVPAKGHIAAFLNAPPFNTFGNATFQGTLTFTSNLPVAAVAIRSLYNERGDFLMSTLPVIDTSATARTGTVVVPHFADGGGWTTQLLLVNPTDNPLNGTIEFRDGNGLLTNVGVAGQTQSSFLYSIPPRTSQRFATSGSPSAAVTGSVRVIPAGGAAPVSQVIFAYKPGQVTVSYAGVPSMSSTALRSYVESSGIAGNPGSIESGIAIANNSATPVTVTLDLTSMDGTPVGLATSVDLPGLGHIGKFLAEFFPNLPGSFQGILRITASAPVAVIGLRGHYNELGDLLTSTTPPIDETAPASTDEMIFPQLADGGGFTTEFILFSAGIGQTPSSVFYFDDDNGQPMTLSLH
jgi:hypothetical protein